MICILQFRGPIRVLVAAELINSGPIETSPRRSWTQTRLSMGEEVRCVLAAPLSVYLL